MHMLDSLLPQMTKEMEIIIVEQDNSDIFTIWPYIKKLHITAQYIYCPKPTPSRAKNIGVQSARGRSIIFFDDDVLMRPKCIQNLVSALKDMSVGLVGGRVITIGQPIEENRTDVGKISPLTGFSDGFSSIIPQDVDTVIGCCMAIRKEVFQQVGGFDEQFDGNALREESDLAIRLKKIGYRILFYPKAEVTHMRAETGGARKNDNRMYWYYHFFSNETYFFLKHRPWILLPFFILSRWEYILRCMFGLGREISFRSILMPWRGIGDGLYKFIKYKVCKVIK